MSSVLINDIGGVRVLTLNRPERLNALNDELRARLLDALREAAGRPDTRVVVISGAGRAFSTGQDITATDELLDAAATVRHSYNPLALTIRQTPKPVIAAINGPAVGAGLGLALACDLRFMAASAYLACSFSRVALVPDTGTSVALLRGLGHAWAFDAAVSGRRILPEEALACRLVNEVVDDHLLNSRAAAVAGALADAPALSIGLTKQLLVAAARDDEFAVLELEAEAQGVAAASPDHRAAVAAFQARGGGRR
jgi:2-(1,2-epoxy-1,2-dihydrophenyl)acetyl-CoA isomerase